VSIFCSIQDPKKMTEVHLEFLHRVLAEGVWTETGASRRLGIEEVV
jgi:hypothetical protein